MSDSEMRTRALEMAVEVCGRSDERRVLGAAKEFYRFLSNAHDDEFFERVMKQG